MDTVIGYSSFVNLSFSSTRFECSSCAFVNECKVVVGIASKRNFPWPRYGSKENVSRRVSVYKRPYYIRPTRDLYWCLETVFNLWHLGCLTISNVFGIIVAPCLRSTPSLLLCTLIHIPRMLTLSKISFFSLELFVKIPLKGSLCVMIAVGVGFRKRLHETRFVFSSCLFSWRPIMNWLRSKLFMFSFLLSFVGCFGKNEAVHKTAELGPLLFQAKV